MSKIGIMIVVVAIGILAFMLISMITFAIACKISPPYFFDEEIGREVHVMAMGQLFIALLVGFITSILTMIISYKKLIK